MNIKCVGIIPIRNKNNNFEVFLILHKSGNYWGFPKGKLENSDLKKEAERELKEETNLEVSKFYENVLNESYSFFNGDKKIHKEVTYFLAEVVGEEKFQEEEVIDGRWFSIDKAFEKITFSNSKTILEKVKKSLLSL